MTAVKKALVCFLTLCLLCTSLNLNLLVAQAAAAPGATPPTVSASQGKPLEPGTATAAPATAATNREQTEILVKYKAGAAKASIRSAVQSNLKLSKLQAKSATPAANLALEVLEIDSRDDISRVISELRKNPNVEYAQPNYLLQPTAIADPLFPEQWALQNSGQAGGTTGIDIGAVPAWAAATGLPVAVGVLDTGIDLTHPDLSQHIYTNPGETPNNGLDDDGNGYIDDIHGWNFAAGSNQVQSLSSEDRHGTQVAGVIAAAANDIGIRGIAPQAIIVPLQFMTNGQGYTSDAIAAIAYARQLDIKIINCSFGSPQDNPALRDAMAAADILFIAAAGNSASDTAVQPIYPAAFDLPNVISVAAIDPAGQLAVFSSYGSDVDLAAPGVGISTTVPGGYEQFSGTSAAAAVVTGIAALAKGQFPDLTTLQLAERLRNSVQPLPALAGKTATGGLANACAALTGTLPPSGEAEPPVDEEDEDVPGDDSDGGMTTLAAEISPELLEMIHYGEAGINPATGNYSRHDTDLSVNAPGFVVNISRTYNSKDTRATSWMGKGWTFGFEGSLKPDTTNPNLMVARLPSGAAQVFTKSGSDYVAYDSRSTLIRLSGGAHVLTTKDQYSYGFNSNGWLEWMKDRNGNALNIQIDDQATGKIGKIIDTVGREYVLTYNASNYIWKVAGPESTVIEYLYTANLLTSVKDAAGSVLTCEYNANGLLTKVVDRTGALSESVSYGMSGMGGVYAIGGYYYDTDYGYGYQSNKVHRYDESTGTWNPVANMAHARLWTAAAAVNNVPYVFGGNTAAYKVEAFDVLSGTWKVKSDMPRPRQSHAAVYANGKVYLIGGTYSGFPTAVDEYDPLSDTWLTKQSSLPTARSSLAAVEYKGKIYVIGGTGPSGTYLSTVEVYDPIADSWVTKRPMPTARYGLTATVINGKIYAIGGYNGTQLSIVEEYDPVSDTWTARQALPSEPRYQQAAAVTGDGILVIGGMINGAWYTRSVLRYSPGSNVWETMQSFPYLVYGLAAVTIEGGSHLTDRQGNRQGYEYNSTTRVATITDSAGRVTTKWYDTSLHVIKSRDPEGKETTVEYYLENGVNKRGEEKSITDRYGNKTEYIRDDRGNITKIINPDQSFREYAYDAKNNLTMEQDEVGNRTYYVYDANGINLLKEVRPLNGTDTYSGVDTPNFSVTSYRYYSENEAQQMTGHALKGLLRSVTDPEGGITGYTYDQWGNRKTVTDPNGNSTENDHNALGWLTETVSPEGYQTDYDYNAVGHLEKITAGRKDSDDIPAITRLTYDNEGRKTGEASPELYQPAQDGAEYTGTLKYRYEYYPSSKLHKLTDVLGNVTEYEYDKYGNKTVEIQPDGSRYEYAYDVISRLLTVKFRQTAGADPAVLEEYTYTVLAGGKRQTTITKHLNATATAVTRLTYDYAGRLIEQENADGGKQVTAYNSNGTVQSVTDPMGATTYYAYDGLNRLTATWSPVEPGYYNYLGIDYDLAGRKVAERQGKDKLRLMDVPLPDRLVVREYSYNPDGKLASESDSSGRRTEYDYDKDGNLSAKRVFTAEQAYLLTEYVNNYLGKPLQQTQYVDSADLVETSGLPLEPLTTDYAYDLNGNLTMQTAPDGAVTTYGYDQLDRLVSVSLPVLDENGQPATATTSTQYNWQNQPIQVTDANGHVTVSTYNSRGWLEQLQQGNGSEAATALYRYDLAGRLITEVTPQNYQAAQPIENLHRTEYAHDRMGRLKIKQYKTPDPEVDGIVTKACAYDLNGNLLKELDGEGFAAGTGSTDDQKIASGYGTEYTYNLANLVVQQLDPATQRMGYPYSVRYQYDGLNRRISATRANKSVTGYYYDDAGNLTSTTVRKSPSDPEQVVSSIQYDRLGHPLTVTDTNGNVTSYQYNAFGKVRQVIYPGDDSIAAYSVQYRYDLRGNLVEQLDSQDRLTTYTYDPSGRQQSQTVSQVDGRDAITTATRYDLRGNLRYQVDGNGVVTEQRYDSLNRLLEVRTTVTGSGDPVVHSTSYTYDPSGNRLSETDWLGNTTRVEYDPLGRLSERFDANNLEIQRLEYDLSHRQTAAYNIRGNGTYEKTEYQYDASGRLLTTIQHAGDNPASTSSQTYDNVGNIASKTDGNNHQTSYGYDQFNRLVSVTAPNGEITAYAYDPNGNLLSQRDPAGNTQYFEYNARNLLVRRVDAGGRTGSQGKYQYDLTKLESYRYNPDGSLAEQLDRNGVTTKYVYDIHGRLLSEQAGDATVSYTYDNNGNLLTMTDSTGTTAQTYDELGRVLVKSVPNIGVSIYQYDRTEGLTPGHVKEIVTDVKGNQTEREFDQLGRLVTVTSDGQIVSYQYYQDGNRQSVTYPNAVETYTYDALGQLSTLVNAVNGSPADSYSYDYDPAGNQTSKTDAKGETNYSYDSLNRLTQVVEPSGRVTEYTYDKAGNRQTEQVTQGSQVTLSTYEYNPQNRLIRLTKESSDGTLDITQYSYDNNGNLTYQAQETLKLINPNDHPSFEVFVLGQTESAISRRVAHYTYDTWNQLISAKTGGTTAEYTYNGAGLRVQKTLNGETTIYVYDGDRVVLELDQQGSELAQNLYGINLLAREVGEECYYYLYNGHADVVALVDATDGTRAASYYYDAFGNILEETGEVDSPILYAGYQYDAETGLYYLNARMYDPRLARFLQEDTYRGDRNDPLSLHLYAYCLNSPLRYVDPSGRTAVRALEESKGNTVHWKSGGADGNDTITIIGSEGTRTLEYGRDFTYGSDGKAHYIGASYDPELAAEVKKDTGRVDTNALAQKGDLAPDAATAASGQTETGETIIRIDGAALIDGALLTGAGVTAVIVGTSVLTAGVALPVIVTVAAAATTAAGAGATVMGTSEVVAGVTGHNLVKEYIFRGDDGKYYLVRNGLVLVCTFGTTYLAPYYEAIQPGDIADETTGVTNVEVIRTPYGDAVQSKSEDAMRARSYVENGGQLYRGGTFGRSNVTDAQFWAPESPTNPGYAEKYGVDFTNLDYVIGGRQIPDAPFITRYAPALGANTGGALEIVNNPNSVKLDFFCMP